MKIRRAAALFALQESFGLPSGYFAVRSTESSHYMKFLADCAIPGLAFCAKERHNKIDIFIYNSDGTC
jgi:hypothetical protein